uniref:protein-tyrosine-phosphatase n=1 Tax=Setaria digitata TaxID=48799 RepID=A0A915PVG7_9BILA
MDEIQSGNLQTEKTAKKKEIQGTALAVLMENRAKAFGSIENKLKKRLFNDITNCQNSKYQKRNVPKTDPWQTSITEYAVVKHRPSISGSLKKTTNKETDGKLKQTAWNERISFSSPQSASEMDIEYEVVEDSSRSIQNESEVQEDIEMYELQTRFSQTLGKRFGTVQQHIHEDAQGPVFKRRKEDEEKDEKSKSGNAKQSKENGILFANNSETDEEFCCKAKYSLVVVQKPSILTAGFACIQKDVLKDLLISMEPQKFMEKYTLVDCRYPYEYDGGHIKGALNIYDPAVLENTFFPKCSIKFKNICQKIPIFYCEYSSARGPMFASHLRKSDRVRNYHKYPSLYYEEIYVLEGGYNSFYNTDDDCFKELCEPAGYVSMRDKRHSNTLKIFHTHSIRSGIGFETGMFQTAVIRKNVDFRRAHSVPEMPESPTAAEFALTRSPEKHHSDTATVPMLINPRTPTGRKSSR